MAKVQVLIRRWMVSEYDSKGTTHGASHASQEGQVQVNVIDQHRSYLGEEVADAGGAQPSKHLHELRGVQGQERDPGLSGDRPGQQRLACAGRPAQQHPLGDPSARRLEAPRLGEEVHHLRQLNLHNAAWRHVKLQRTVW